MRLIYLFSVLLFLYVNLVSSQRQCSEKRFQGDNMVCTCNATYCDDVPKIPKLDRFTAAIITSSLTGHRFATKKNTFEPKRKSAKRNDVIRIRVDPRTFYQEIYGFGGAFTDAAGINLASLSVESRGKLLEAFFSKENGIGYTFGRVPMASTDFGTREYSYVDQKDDFELKTFALQDEDIKYKIPFILQAQNITGGTLRLFSSPWSAPGWMKTNNRMIGGAPLKGDLNSTYYVSWANYFVKFFEKYADQGVHYWGLTMQNEPTSGINPDYTWQTMYFNAFMQREFLVNHLGPALQKNPLTKGLKVMVLDDDRPQLPSWADEIWSDPLADQFAHGIGIHWYMDTFARAELLTETAIRHPNKFILATEACSGFLGIHGPILGDWGRAESYAADIIDDLNNFVVGWVDWNLCLDTNGGPTFVGNFADSPILVNASADVFYKQPIYYAMGHFSAWIPVGSDRIKSTSYGNDGSLKFSAFTHRSRRTLVILNRGDAPKSIAIEDALMPERILTAELEGHSITTILWHKA
ncbi:unnamed protein product, partial [Mesorhabditis belari]|uniref:Glucosylceramidase n=1 Tax=Mesorhabditis belari TaxID=2138241 RepID=A0AAF3EYR7_9BILA